MDASRETRRRLLVLAALAAAAVTAVVIQLALRDRGGSPAAPTLDEWLAGHPSGSLDYALGTQVDLEIPRGQSVVLHSPVSGEGAIETQLGTDGSSLFMEIRRVGNPESGPQDPESLGGSSGSQALVVGQMCNEGPPNPFYALTCQRVGPGGSPLPLVRIHFVMDSASGETTQAARQLEARRRRGEITDAQHMREIDTLIFARWPNLGWQAR